MLRRLGRTEFVRADIRSPLIGKVIAAASVDTVVMTRTPFPTAIWVSSSPTPPAPACTRTVSPLRAG